jgi:hypothetical protein
VGFGTAFALHRDEARSSREKELTMHTADQAMFVQGSGGERAYANKWAVETGYFRLVMALGVAALAVAPVVLGWTAAMLL